MSTPNPEQLMYQIVGKAEEINALAIALLTDRPGAFEPISQRMPKFVPAELGFLRLVSWLYVLYLEAGKVSVPYLSQRFDAYGLDPGGNIRRHLSTIQKLRTYTQHNLDSEETHDKGTIQDCQIWFSAQCETAVPDSESEWNRCVMGLPLESLGFLEVLLTLLRLIEKDESRVVICSDWRFRRDRYHSPHEFEAIAPKVASDMGNDSIDAARLVRRNYDRWAQCLRAFSSGYNFETEARKLIENAILTDLVNLMPITGQDIIREFNLEPGAIVGRLLGEARKLYQQEPCTREQLLERLKPISSKE
jgi:hypothetical protein